MVEYQHQVSHGDAQSDILGGASIIAIVLFVGMAALVALLLAVLSTQYTELQSVKTAHAELEKKERKLRVANGLLAGKTLTPAQIEEILTHNKLKKKLEGAQSELAALKQAQSKRKSEVRELKRGLAEREREVEKKDRDIAKLQKQLERTQAELEKVKKGTSAVANQMRLWVFDGGKSVDISDLEPEDDGKFWRLRYRCRKINKKVPSTTEGGNKTRSYIIGH